jgi:hypothetical protein
MRMWGRLLYWFIAGAFLGIGLGGIASIGLPFLLVSVPMLIYGLSWLGGRDFWAALIGFGALPVLLIVYGDRLHGDGMLKRCPPGWGLTIVPDTPGGTLLACGEITQSALYFALFFGAVLLGGVIWGLVTLFSASNTDPAREG